MKKLITSIIVCGVLVTQVNAASDNKVRENRGSGSVVIKDGMYKDKKPLPPKGPTNKRMYEMLIQFEDEKVTGFWDLNGTKTLGGDISWGRSNAMNADFYDRGGLRSISKEQKAKFKVIDDYLSGLMKKKGITENTLNTKGVFEGYRKAFDTPLATNFDITSPGHFLTAEQWKNFITDTANKDPKKKKKRNYRRNTQTINASPEEMLHDLVDAVYEATYTQSKKGITINPDFLVAMSINETGWGQNKYAVNNSWFSVGAFNSNPNNATRYATPYDAVEDVIRLLVDNYVKEGSKHYQDSKGPSMVGLNTKYAQLGVPYSGFPEFNWSATSSSIIVKACKYNNVKIPNF